MNNSQKTFRLASALVRGFSNSAPRSAEAVPKRILKLREAQKKFGVEDNTPVYLKGGLGDKLLFQGTCLLTLVGLSLSLQVFYNLTFKK